MQADESLYPQLIETDARAMGLALTCACSGHSRATRSSMQVHWLCMSAGLLPAALLHGITYRALARVESTATATATLTHAAAPPAPALS
jgi:hypothetical protein